MKLLLFLLAAAPLSAQLLPGGSGQSPPSAAHLAKGVVDMVNAQLTARIAARQQVWDAFWMSPYQPPDAICAAFGNTAGPFFSASLRDATLFTTLATDRGLTIAQLIGAANVQFLGPPAAYTLVVNSDGTASIAIKDGWARVILNNSVTLQGPSNAIIKP